MARIERHLERVTAAAGGPLAAHASATIGAGGKRLRPLLVVLAAEAAEPPKPPAARADAVDAAEERPHPRGGRGRARALRDARARRRDRRRPAAARTVPPWSPPPGAGAAIATGDLLFSRAFAELARNEEPAQLRALSDASSALAAGELLQREDAYARATSRSSATCSAAS